MLNNWILLKLSYIYMVKVIKPLKLRIWRKCLTWKSVHSILGKKYQNKYYLLESKNIWKEKKKNFKEEIEKLNMSDNQGIRRVVNECLFFLSFVNLNSIVERSLLYISYFRLLSVLVFILRTTEHNAISPLFFNHNVIV